jgi:phosphodiesterase/alkaline phosphatase D-like protein
MMWKRLFQSARRKTLQRAARRVRLRFETLECRNLPSVSFLGVGAGDATSSDAILWTRAQDSSSLAGVGLMAQVSADPTFATGLATFAGTTDPAHDFTIHVDALGLQPGTRYYYRFVASDNTMSPAGTFATAPGATTQTAVNFGFTGDADGLMRPYDATNSANFAPPTSSGVGSGNFDYFVWLGDTIYETASGQGTPNFSPAVNNTPNIADYWRKYREQFLPVNTGSYAGLSNFFDSTGHYTLLDNHELGNRQLINGGAPASVPFNTTDPQFDVNTTGTYMHNTAGYKVVQQAYDDYQPIRVSTVSAPSDPRSDGTQKMYFAQQWGANSIFINVDDRTDRDIRLRKASGTGTADDTGARADNPGRTMLGATQLQWLEQSLVTAQQQGMTWKIVAISSPIDQIGAIGSNADGGKSWMGGYRAERNALLKYIADNHIDHVLFLSTDDHQVRVNELGYFTQFTTNSLGYLAPVQSSYVRVPGAMSIVVGPIGATGPDTITDHSFANIKSLADALVASETAAGVDPIGLDPAFAGLKNVTREGDPNAGATPTAFDFYSPDTFNYATLNISADGSTLTFDVKGINSYQVNTFPQPGDVGPVRDILSFQIGLEHVNVAVAAATATAGGTTTLSATLTDASTNSALAGRTLVFSLNGQVVGTATTDSTGTASLPGVSVAGLLPGHYAGAVTVHFAGDAADLAGDGSAALDVLPAHDVTDQVHVRKNGPVMGPKDGTFTADLTITNRMQTGGAHSTTNPALAGLFAIELNNLTPGVTLDSATMSVNGVTYNLTITFDAAGDPIINVPAAVATSLAPGESLPKISLVFKNPGNKHFDFDTAVFTDPLV